METTIQNLTPKDLESVLPKVIDKYLNTKIISSFYSGGGTFGVVYTVVTLEGKIVIKAFRGFGMHKTQAYETKTLSNYSTVPMPKTLFLHDADEDIPFDIMGMECMPGVTASEINPRFRLPSKKRKLANELAECIYKIHSAHNNKFGYLETPEFDNWIDFYKPFAKKQIDWLMQHWQEPEHQINRFVAEVMLLSWEHFDEIFAEPISNATLTHGDLDVFNFMCDPKTLQLTALIDPWQSMWADGDYDLHQLRILNGEKFGLYETYKSRFPVSETCDLKCAFYTLYKEISCYISYGTNLSFVYQEHAAQLAHQMKHFLGLRATDNIKA